MKKIPFIIQSSTLALALCVGVNLSTLKAQNVVFTENWETDHSLDGTYRTNFTATGAHVADLFFDYSTAGVPLSPNSTGSSTRALKMAANLVPGGTFPLGVSVSPVGFGITANFELRFDAWFNFNGPFPGGGNGSTQVGGAGYGTAGTNAQVAGVADSVYIGGTADGGSSADFRVYSPSHQSSYQDGDFQIGSDGIAQTTKGDPNSGYVYAAEDGTRNVVPGATTGYYATNFPGQTAPLAQLSLFPQQTNSTGPANEPGTVYNGALAFKWHDISLQKLGNSITYLIDGVLVATVNVTDAGTLGGTNILFNHYDINATASSDPNRTNLIFTLIDNVRVTEFTNVVSVTATTPDAKEAGPTPGVFTITRSAGGTPVTINYTLSGTATNGVDYNNALGGPLSGSVTFAANDLSTNIVVVPVDDAIPEVSESIKLSINPSGSYFGAGSAIVTISDNETPQLTITNVSSQMYERTNDYAAFRVTRLGDTNTPAFNVNLSFAGATAGTDFYASTVSIEPGAQSAVFNIYPIADGVVEGNETIATSIAAAGGGEYSIGSPSVANITLVDADLPAETILFQDTFDTDSSANWNLYFAAGTNNTTPDYNALFAFDYGAQGIPPAPHGNGSSSGLFLNVNKDATGSAAALNLYPIGQNFSGNFALRFDMFLSVPQGSTVATEYMLAGLNHSGTKTNWWRSGGVPAGSTFDGLFFALETDNQSSPNYATYSSPTTAALNPTLVASNTAASVAAAFKSPPWINANTPANNNNAGSFNTPIWADVEISKSGNLITLIINNTKVYTYSNATAYASGNIMIGYEDAFDSISAFQSYAVVDNVRVVTITPPVITGQPANTTNAVGTPASFSVTATTTTGVTNYQWFRNSVAITGATNATYAIGSVASTNFGSYRVEVSDGRYTTVSSTASLVSPAPVINIQPTSRAAVVGSSPTLSVTATTFSGTTNYQWLYYGTNVSGTGVSGATTRVLTLGGIQPVRFNGPYTVRVNDGTTSITSAPAATITIAVSPTIAAPQAVGANLVFSYPSEVGPNYVVDFKSALTNVAWTPIATNAGTGGPINFTNALSGNQGYFRIRLQ